MLGLIKHVQYGQNFLPKQFDLIVHFLIFCFHEHEICVLSTDMHHKDDSTFDRKKPFLFLDSLFVNTYHIKPQKTTTSFTSTYLVLGAWVTKQ